jgi:alkaline phosphatase D
MKRFIAFWVLCLPLCCFAAKEKPIATVALLSDTHTIVRTNDHDGVYEQHFERAIAQVNKADVDFVLITGDLSNGGQPEQLREFRNRTKKFKAPVYYVPGNHDVGHKMNSGKPNGFVTVEKVKDYERVMGPSFFAKEAHGVHVIGLTASLFGSGLEREREQWKFIDTEMAKTNDTLKIVFMHYPLFVTNAAEPGGNYWNVEPEERQRLLKLFEQAKVEAVLTGHLHKPLTNHYDGMLLLGTPAISFGFPRNAKLEGWTLVKIWKDRKPTFELMLLDKR